MTQNKKTVLTVPFAGVCLIIFYTWFVILTTEYTATFKHQIGLGLFLLNLVLYPLQFNYAVKATGLYLILTTANLISIYPDSTSASFFLTFGDSTLATTPIELRSFFILVIYAVIMLILRRKVKGSRVIHYSPYYNRIAKLILEKNGFEITEVKELHLVMDLNYVKENYLSMVDLIKKSDMQGIKALDNNRIQSPETLTIFRFKNQENQLFRVTVYNSDALRQSPVVFDIIPK